ncbi:hypothetical protein GJ629_09565 [Halapricum sp. CBA1109]|uniref:hypothetical protein n=1 Tax=Halapricum sp. CBA1109 TaxID=2668068 RepID=UPI0012F751D9|nr:hypothetical protein [Halapricum sp. CBA1109]MUV90108.1 hypothetical protein [Halapricum sp. CBA1109]
MVEVGVIITLATVVLLLLLVPVSAWIIPKALESGEDEEEDLPERSAEESAHEQPPA